MHVGDERIFEMEIEEPTIFQGRKGTISACSNIKGSIHRAVFTSNVQFIKLTCVQNTCNSRMY
jgi:hypothetical protein